MTTKWRDLPTMADVAAALAAKDEIEIFFGGSWIQWDSTYWSKNYKFRARPYKPATKKIKMLCFYNGASLFWHESGEGCAYRCRVPSEDKEVEVQDDA